MSDAQYEIFPAADGTWGWRLPGSTDGEAGLGTRSDAITGARRHRGDGRLSVTREDGSLHSEWWERGGPQRIVLLRLDGSVYGEIEHALPADGAGEAQHVDVSPAGETGQAGG